MNVFRIKKLWIPLPGGRSGHMIPGVAPYFSHISGNTGSLSGDRVFVSSAKLLGMTN